MIGKEDLADEIKSLEACEKCRDVQIKKFSPLKDLIDLDCLDSDYMRCECGKRPLDVVMSHILKIMIEEEIVKENATLRRNSPIPLSGFYYSSMNPQFIGKDMLILVHPDFTQEVGVRLLNEVPEVKGVLKGNGRDVVGQFDRDSDVNHFELLGGDDTQTNVMRTLIGEKIILTKSQSKQHIEVATTTEEKLVRLHNYLKNNNIKKGIGIDAMCGCGALGIYLLKYGFEKVIFNDIYGEAIESVKNNLEINEIFDGYEIRNEAFEDLEVEHADLCIIDAYPGADITEIQKKAEKIADNVVII